MKLTWWSQYKRFKSSTFQCSLPTCNPITKYSTAVTWESDTTELSSLMASSTINRFGLALLRKIAVDRSSTLQHHQDINSHNRSTFSPKFSTFRINSSHLLPGLWRDSLHVTCGPTACTPGSAPGPTLGNEYGKTLPLPFNTSTFGVRSTVITTVVVYCALCSVLLTAIKLHTYWCAHWMRLDSNKKTEVSICSHCTVCVCWVLCSQPINFWHDTTTAEPLVWPTGFMLVKLQLRSYSTHLLCSLTVDTAPHTPIPENYHLRHLPPG